jgi:transglutaminase-like putative cysteine protease
MNDQTTYTDLSQYSIAFVMEDGSWDIFEPFNAANDDDANAYAEKHFDGKGWYVLDARGRNINGGDQE